MKIRCFCEQCNKWVEAELLQIGKGGIVTVKLACGHVIYHKFLEEEKVVGEETK